MNEEMDQKESEVAQQYKNIYDQKSYNKLFCYLLNSLDNLLYQGSLKDEKYHGKGILFYSNKCFFHGYFHENKKEKGIEIFPNGDRYNGDYFNDKFHGNGILENERLSYKYEGKFENGKKHGFGTETLKNGTIYQGHFFNNNKQGKGKIIYPDGRTYEGDIKNGLPHGFGLFFLFASKNQNQTLSTIKEINDKKKNLYIPLNEMNEPKYTRPISQIFENEPIYEGEFCMGLKHGFGRLYDNKGNYKYGTWKMNEMDGKFTQYFSDENRWEYKQIDHNKNIKLLKYGNEYPPIELDAYKSILDEAILKRVNFLDPFFPPKIEAFSFKNINLKDITFEKIGNLKKKQRPPLRLFLDEIQPNQIIFKEFPGNIQDGAVLEALSYFPHLIIDCITPKYQIEAGYYIVKLYIDGEWREIAIDEFIPMMNSEPMLPSTKELDIGYIIIQKALAKNRKFYFIETNDQIFVGEIYKLLTSRPIKIISFENFEKIEKYFIKNPNNNSAKISFLNEKKYLERNLPINVPYFLLQSYKVEEKTYFLFKSCVENWILKESFLFDKLKPMLGLNDPLFFLLDEINVKQLFNDVYFFMGMDNYQKTNYRLDVSAEKDMNSTQTVYTYEFKITWPTKFFINIEQILEALPARLNICQMLPHRKKRNRMEMKYILGKGQTKTKDLFKETYLDSGNYILLLEFENDQQTDKSYPININIFAEYLIQLKERKNFHNYKQKIYKSAIIMKFQQYNEGCIDKMENFSVSNLKEKVNGSEDLKILQYFLKQEGTYLHYLINDSSDKKWKQKLYFRVQKMQILTKNSSEESNIDVILRPKKKVLYIIQQKGGGPFFVEGGDGPCFIENESSIKDLTTSKVTFNSK